MDNYKRSMMETEEAWAAEVEGSTGNDRGPEQRTFEQILAEDYGGNLTACLEALLGDSSHLSSISRLLTGAITTSCIRSALICVAHALGSEVDSIFPPSLYLKKLYASLDQTPGWKLLSSRYNLIYWNRKLQKQSFNSLCGDKGLSRTETQFISNALIGHRDVTSDSRALTEKLCLQLGFTFEELFPSDIYRYKRIEEDRDIKKRRSDVSLDGIRGASRIFLDEKQPDADVLQMEQEEINERITSCMEKLSPRRRLVLTHRYKHEETLEDVGTRLNITKERVRQIEGDALRDLRGLMKGHRIKTGTGKNVPL